MKVVRGILVFFINIVLLVLIISFSLLLRVKNFVEKDVVVPVIKEATMNALKDEDVTDEQKELIEDILADNSFEQIIDRIIQNFITFRTDKTYVLPKEDYDRFINFVLKYRDDINKVSNRSLSEQDIRDSLKYEDIKEYIIDVFDDFNENADREMIEAVLDTYTNITSMLVKIIFVAAIVFQILLIMLVSWSLITWMLVAGIDLIISGVLVGILYFTLMVVRSLINVDVEMMELIKSINLNGFIIMAIIEVSAGILLIVIYSILHKNMNAKKLNQA